MKEFFFKIEASFKKAMRGEESVQILIWWWGVIGYLVAFFIARKLIRAINFHVADVVISLLMITYFSWHFYVLKKCAPKKPKLTTEEKRRLKEERRREMGKRVMRKLFLQEPITKWDPVLITLVIDVFCVVNFFHYILR